MIDPDHAHAILRLSHAAVGFAGLALFWVPVFARKGGRLHVRCGRLFCWCAYYVGVTGLVASVWGVVHPASFLSNDARGLSAAEQRIAAENARFILTITGFLALAVLSGVVLGVRAMRTRERHEELRSALLLALEWVLLAWSAALIVYGAASLVAALAGWHFVPPQAAAHYLIPLLLGSYGLYGASCDLRYIRGPQPAQMTWWFTHMQCMLGAGAGFHAAFFLFGASRLFPLDGLLQLVAPLVPLAVGSVATTLWVRRYERKFERDANRQGGVATIAVSGE